MLSQTWCTVRTPRAAICYALDAGMGDALGEGGVQAQPVPCILDVTD